MTAKRDLFTYPGTITLDTLPDLLAFHRKTFGGFRMEDGADGADGGSGEGEKGKSEFEPITSQADLDKRLGERLARERAKFSDYDDLKAKAAEHDKALDAARTDQERAVEAARKEGETSALERANGRLVAAEARALAAHARFRDPADAVAFLKLKDVKVADDGEVDADAIKAQLKTLADSKPYLVDDGKKPAPKADKSQGGGTSGGSGKNLTDLDGAALYDRLHPKKTA